MEPIKFTTQLNFTFGSVKVVLPWTFFGNGLTKDPFSHTHPMFELHYIVEGSCTVETQKQTVTCQKGQFLILPPNCVHRLLPHGDATQTITLLFDLQEEHQGLSRFQTKDLLLCDDKWGGQTRIYSIRKELEQKRPVYIEKIRGELTALLADIFREFTKSADVAEEFNEDRAAKISSYLVQYRFRADCSCEDLAKKMHISVRQLHRLCLQYYGATFRELLMSMRMETAAYRLSTTDVSISELASQLGYSSPASFSASYKRYFGKSPSQDRTPDRRV